MLQLTYNQHLASGRTNRRQWLRMGLATSLAAIAPQGSRANERSGGLGPATGFGRAKSVIVVFAHGGQSQIDTWDPKPDAPLDVRGDFRPIATALPGVQVCEHLPHVARLMDRLTLVRSMSHEDLDHGSAVYLTLTGSYHARRSSNPPPRPTDVPTQGAVIRKLRPSRQFTTSAIHINGPALAPIEVAAGQHAGLLGKAYDPLVIGDASAAAGAVPGLAPLDDVPTLRLSERLSLKESLDAYAQRLAANPDALAMNRLYGQAYDMLASPKALAAFDLEQEPARLRDRYGRHRSGQGLLLARRLVEAGVPYINVIWSPSNRGQDEAPDDTDAYGWDTHNDIFDALRNRLLPRFDRSFAALVEDLDERGLLDQTLVVCMGEFGRAPRVALEPRFAGASPGRKHWASVYSIVAAGAGVQRGAVVGASDRMGGEPVSERYGPWDLSATIYHALGIDPAGHYFDPLDRPLQISAGRPIAALYGS
ncbi:MAG: DUF1501 domain-containing protein [Pirellulaceae bacterium]|nr:DUF1501 domain-containing protein [Pirellulaceae bacterium]